MSVKNMRLHQFFMIVSLPMAVAFASAAAELPDAIAAKGETVVLRVQAVGAQIYECKASQSATQPSWQFREPIASLFQDDKTIGRHYAGPSWEIDGSAIVAKVTGSAPGATANDIAWLKLRVTEHRGEGLLKDVSTVQRIDTRGGVLKGACSQPGDLRATPYSAEYVFLKK
jgi:Protein of unknown function (DUF3455)